MYLITFIHNNKGWLLTHLFVVVMGIMLVINPQNWKPLTSYSGYAAVGFLIALLSLNPLKKLQPKLMLVTYLNRYRRELGVAAFSFATVHLICFIIKRGGIFNTLPYALHPAIAPALLVAYPIFFLLAITSNQYSVKKLTFVKWKKLHSTVYIAEAGIILHMILVGQKMWAAILFIPVLILQFMRRRSAPKKINSK
jgi:methionine sulfoxide reductase heme-binding subunit